MLLLSTMLKAVSPNWTVTPASFQYSMSVLAVAEINCTELTNPSVKLGAFVGNQLRGTALASNVNNNRYVASLIVYSNLASGETITFKFYNPTNDSIYNANSSLAFQENASYGTSVSPVTFRNNSAPTSLTLSSLNVNEALSINSTVGSFTSLDSDAGETFTYSLVSGTGSSDNANFNILGTTLRTSIVFNFSQKSSYTIRVRTTDANGCNFEQSFVINILDVNTAPSQILISDSTIFENSSSLTTIGNLLALDQDESETFTYSLVNGIGSTDNGNFNIQGTTLRSFTQFNFETKSNYSIRIRVTDAANNVFERVITILVKNANDVPTNVLLNGNSTGISFAENKLMGTVIGFLSTIDEDVSNTFSYSFVDVSGNNNSDFTITGNQLRTNSLFDFETRQNYVVFIQANDGNGGMISKQLLLSVIDSNDAPTAINLSNTSVNENVSIRTFIAKLSANDADASGNYTYSLVSGSGSSGNANFLISNDSLYTNGVFDFETVNTYNIRINVNDGFSGTFQNSFQINILNVNDIPTDLNISSNQIIENSAANTSIGVLTTTDQDAGNTFTYSLVSGIGSTDNNSFNISSNTLRSSTSFDYETKKSYSVRIRTTDNAGTYFEKIVSISITDALDIPSNITISNDTINENLAINTLIGTLTGYSQDSIANYSFSFDANLSANDNDKFIISGNQLRSNLMFDYEAKNVYTLYIKVNTSATTSFTKTIQIKIRNQNDAPSDIALSFNTIKENKPALAFIGLLSTSDADANSSFTYSLTGGVGANNNGLFAISNDSLFTASILDFESQNTFSIRVKSLDNGGLMVQKVFTIMVSDSNDAPSLISLTANAIYENQALGTFIATMNTVDADAGQSFSYSLVGGLGSTNNSLFNIIGNQLRANANFDFESKSTYKIRIQTNDGNGGSYADTFTINILNNNDIPTNITLSNNVFVENRNVNSLIGTLTTADQDVSDLHYYSFVDVTGNDNAAFYIFGNQLRSNSNFNFEAKQVYSIYLQSSDGITAYTKQFIVNIADSNDSPTNIILSNSNINENLPFNSFVSMLYSSDADANNVFSYSLINGTGSLDNNRFIIRNDSLLTNFPFNFESKSSFSIRIKTTDNGALSFEKQFDVTINNSNDNPTDVFLSANEITENRVTRTLIGTFTSLDQDATDKFSYTLVNGTGSADNASFIIQGNELRSNRSFNFEQQKLFTIRIQTNDANGGLFEKSFVINAVDSNDGPNNIVLSSQIIAENSLVGSKVADINTLDQDTLETFIYSFINIGGNQNSNFFIIGNELRTNTVFDYETKNFYIIYLQSTDAAGNNTIKQFLINIKDSVDAPTAMDLEVQSVSENIAIGSTVGYLSTSDADQINNFNYTLVSGVGSNDNSQFTILNEELKTNVVFNFEVKKQYTIRVRVTDITNAIFEKQFTISINDTNDAPTAFAISNTKLNENAIVATEIGIFSTSDVDINDSHVYSLVAGTGSTDNIRFLINENKLVSNFIADYELKNAYSIRVRTTDIYGDFIENTFTIDIVDVNETPGIVNQKFTIGESDSVSYVLGKVVATSPDLGALLSFTFVENQTTFSLNPTTGELALLEKLDYEKQNVYRLKVVVADGNLLKLTDTAEIEIKVSDIIELKQALPANNYLSPNNDGVNDLFEIDNVSLYADYSLTIFTESGQEVFKVENNYQNNWDATYDGKTLSVGVYYYVFRNSNNSDTFKGSINIIR